MRADITVVRKLIAHRIRSRREYLGLTQEDVSLKLGISRVAYSHWETGRNEPGSSDLPTLGEILKVPVSYFYGETTEDEIEDDVAYKYYKGLPPLLKPTARALLKTLHDAQDMEDDEGTIGRKAK